MADEAAQTPGGEVAAGERPKRVDVGFSGGQVLALRMAESVYRDLLDALERRDGDVSWHQVDTEDSQVAVDLGQVVYVRLDTEHQRVGF